MMGNMLGAQASPPAAYLLMTAVATGSRAMRMSDGTVRKGGLPPPMIVVDSQSGGKPPFLTVLFKFTCSNQLGLLC